MNTNPTIQADYDMSDKISIIVPAFNQGRLTVNLLNDLIKTCGVKYEIILIDDGSTELIYKVLPKLYSDIKIIQNEINEGFIKSVNKGITEATGNYILLLNNDTEIKDIYWLKKLLDGAKKRNLDMAGVAGARMNEKTWEYLPGEVFKENDKFTYLPFWCCLIKKRIIDKIGMLDEQFGRGFFDDLDFNLRALNAGFKLGVVEGIKVKHLYHQTFKASGINITEQYIENREIFLRKLSKHGSV